MYSRAPPYPQRTASAVRAGRIPSYAVRSGIDWRGHGWDTTILIDGDTGQLRAVDRPRGQHFGNTLSTLLWGIHLWRPAKLASLSHRHLRSRDQRSRIKAFFENLQRAA